jgi:hypothetical protein
MKHLHFLIIVTIILLELVAIKSTASSEIVKIPLTYVFDWDFINKIPVRISFNHSFIYSTNPT